MTKKTADCGRYKASKGFSLIELMVVIAIIGILAFGVVGQFSSPATRVKAVSFALRSDVNFVRSESVRRNRNVVMEFVNGTADLDGDGANDDGYYIYIDDDGAVADDDEPPGDEGTYTAGADELIKVVVFTDDVNFYDPAAAVAGGPALVDDGIDFVAAPGVDFTSFGGDGLLVGGGGGNILLYAPGATSRPAVIAARVSSIGRVTLHRWNNGAWDPP